MRARTLFDDVVARGRLTVVRRKRLEDATDEFRWRSDLELAEFDASRPVHIPFENYERNWSFDFRFTDMPARSFAIEDGNGRHIGNVMYYNYDPSRGDAEIGISIGDRQYWENGYGTDALKALVAALFREGDIRRLYLHTLDWNHRAQRAFTKVGFRDCGMSWRDGRTFVMMELHRDQVDHRIPARAVTA